MSSHDRNLVLIISVTALLVTLNFLAVVTGNAEAVYTPVNDFFYMVSRGNLP